MQLDLTDHERQELDAILDQSLRGIREEIYKAEVADYKARLKAREDLLKGLLHRLRGLAAS